MRATRSAEHRLRDILDAISAAREASAGLTLDAFKRDAIRRLATERAIEIISEASRHIPPDLKLEEPSIPWRDIADIGNILRHAYDRADPDVVWRVVQFDLDPLEGAVVRLLDKASSKG